MTSNFVTDAVTLPFPKTDLVPVPGDPTKYVAAVDWNAVCQAAVDLKNFVLTGLPPGTYPLSTLTVDANGRITAVSAGTGLTDGDKGDIVVSGSGSTFTIDSGVVSNTKLALMSAGTIKGNNTGSFAAPANLSVVQVINLLGLADIALSGSGADLIASSVINSKLAAMAANTVKGNNTGSSTTPIDLTVAQLQAMLQLSVGGLGDGSDGPAVFDGVGSVAGYSRSGSTYTATRETAFTSATFSNGVVLEQTNAGAHAGFRVFFSGLVTVLSGTATITFNGNPGSGITGGLGLGNNPQGNNSAEGGGAAQNAGTAGFPAGNWSNSVKGGTGGTGGASLSAAGGAGASVSNTFAASLGDVITWTQAQISRIGMSNPGILTGGGGGGGGGGTVGIASGGAGGGGGGVGVVGLQRLASTGTLIIEARGGAGGNAQGGIGSNAAGGGGGGGGILFVGFGGAAQPSNLTLQCPSGAGGTPAGSGATGGVGTSGTVRFYPLGAA